MKHCFGGIYDGLRVLITGHTGFKGSWLTLWLCELGADMIGYSLEPPTTPNLFEACQLEKRITHLYGDVRDYNHLHDTITKYRPDVIFHLAAQPLVLASYGSPRDTFEVNVQGSVNLLEAVRRCPSVQAVVMITTDKVYENKNWLWGYRENDSLGGRDPYSASKAMAEMAIASYRCSFFQNENNRTAIASARAGNVIGGGDFSPNRLLPDILHALTNHNSIPLRHPNSVRPWMHVLEPLSGYLQLAKKLLRDGSVFAEAWNFGPQELQIVTCQAIAEKAIQLWGSGSWHSVAEAASKPEMELLQLDSAKALKKLQWKPCYTWIEALQQTIEWSKTFQQASQEELYETCITQIDHYIQSARQQQCAWAVQQNEEIFNPQQLAFKP